MVHVIHPPSPRYWWYCVLLLGMCARAAFSGVPPRTLWVQGWPFVPEVKTWVTPLTRTQGYDPMVGRLICPSLTRLNLLSKTSEPLVLKKVTSMDPQWWSYQLRQGIFWWNGRPLMAPDVAVFMEKHLKAIVHTKSAGLWPVPAFQVTPVGPYEVQIRWASSPVFGPYLWNGIPISRLVGEANPYGMVSECVGTYHPAPLRLPQQNFVALRLVPTAAYHIPSHVPAQEILFLKVPPPTPIPPSERLISFKMPFHFLKDGGERNEDMSFPCTHPFELPLISVIGWNLQSPLIKDPKTRILLTQLTPRGALLRSGAGGLGTLPSSVIPRNHPGYHTGMLVRPYAPKQVLTQLPFMGLTLQHIPRQLLTKDKHIAQLTLTSLRNQEGVLEKVLLDSFRVIGFKASLADAPTDGDGWIGGWQIPVPEIDLLEDLHSQVAHNPLWKGLYNHALDVLLEKYAISLTHPTPLFGALQEIHRYVYEREPFTPLIHHHACLTLQHLVLKGDSVRPGDGDWFKHMLLQDLQKGNIR